MVNLPGSDRPAFLGADPPQGGPGIQSPLPAGAQPAGSLSPRVSPPLGWPLTAVCPRCKQESTPAAGYCARCGFSFLETRAVEARPAPAPSVGLVGEVINGKYRVLSVLGEGGFGVVYKVELLLFETGNIFALKLLHPALSADMIFRRRFLREAGLALTLIHENTIQIREFGQMEDGQLFFTMDYCQGDPLKVVIAKEGFLTVNRALHVTRQILSVMKLAHTRGIIHRDLKPENIFLEKDAMGRDFVKVGDFGLAKSFAAPVEVPPGSPAGSLRPPTPRGRDAAAVEDITRGGIVGTPRYMSPEQAQGEELDGRSDLYSIGVILHEMLHGQVPAERGAAGGGPFLAGLVAAAHAVPADVSRLLRKAIEPRREDRFQSAGEFLDAMNALPAYTPTYLHPVPARRRRLMRLPKAVVMAAAVAALIGTGILLGDPRLVGLRELLRKEEGVPRVAYPAGVDPPRSDTLLAPAAEAAREAKGAVPSVLPRSARLSPFPSEGVRAYIQYRKGDVLRYQGYREGMVADREFTYEIIDETGPGSYVVKASPGDRKFRWVIEPEENAFYHEFPVPHRETGELSETARRAWLRLPRTDAVVDGDYIQSDIRVHAEPVDLKAPPRHPRCDVFRACLLVELREEERLHYHYYQEGRGLVGIEVYELRADEEDGKKGDGSQAVPSSEAVKPPAVASSIGAAAASSGAGSPPAKVLVYARYLMDHTGWEAEPPPQK